MKRIGSKDWHELAKAARAIAEKRGAIDALIAEINEIRMNVHETLYDCANAAEDYYDERSDKWRDGDNGNNYATWKDAIGTACDTFDNEIEFDASEIEALEDELNNNLMQEPEA